MQALFQVRAFNICCIRMVNTQRIPILLQLYLHLMYEHD
jgi:hypothetical protein